MMPSPNYLDLIALATTRFEAAHLVRAFGCSTAATIRCSTAPARLDIVEAAHQHAETLERDYTLDGDATVDEDLHPWRSWLLAWGYLPGFTYPRACPECGATHERGRSCAACDWHWTDDVAADRARA